MPFCSAAASALRLDVVVVERGFAASSSVSSFIASATVVLQVLAPPAAAHLLEHALDLAGQLLHAGRRHDFHLRRRATAELDFHFAVVERHLRAASCGISGAWRSPRRLHVGEADFAAPAAAARRAGAPRRRRRRGREPCASRLRASA